MITDDAFELIIQVARESQRPATWLSLSTSPACPKTGCNRRCSDSSPPSRAVLSSGSRPPAARSSCLSLYVSRLSSPVFRPGSRHSAALRKKQASMYRSKESRDSFKSDLSRGGGVAFRASGRFWKSRGSRKPKIKDTLARACGT